MIGVLLDRLAEAAADDAQTDYRNLHIFSLLWVDSDVTDSYFITLNRKSQYLLRSASITASAVLSGVLLPSMTVSAAA